MSANCTSAASRRELRLAGARSWRRRATTSTWLARLESLADERQRTRPGIPRPRRTGARRAGTSARSACRRCSSSRTGWVARALTRPSMLQCHAHRKRVRCGRAWVFAPAAAGHTRTQAAALRAPSARGTRRRGGACVSWSDGQPSQIERPRAAIFPPRPIRCRSRGGRRRVLRALRGARAAHRRRQARRHGGLHERRAARLRRPPGARCARSS